MTLGLCLLQVPVHQRQCGCNWSDDAEALQLQLPKIER